MNRWWIAGAVASGVLLAAGVVYAVDRRRPAALGAGVAPENALDPAVPASYRDDYITRWGAASIRPDRAAAVDRVATAVLHNKGRYDAVAAVMGVPWWVIGALHNLESGMSFTRHLHNGDPLTARTVQVPRGRPVAGDPPFTWEESAVDALAYDHLTGWDDWNLVGALYKAERFNGLGYRSRGIPSPYLWSGTNQYDRGKFVSDGVYDPNAVSTQVGVAAVWKRLVELGVLSFATSPASAA